MDKIKSTSFDLIRISVEDNEISLQFVWFVPALIIFIALVIWAYNATKTGRLSKKTYELTQISVGNGANSVILRPSYGDRELAYKIWVELSTRKIGLAVDPENDVVSEIYDSWYSFFQVTREMIKDVPVLQVRNAESQKIINLSVDVLNEGLRPHLTKWQARFRRWYQARIDLEDNFDYHPQDVQKKFPDYDSLMTELLQLNGRLEIYRTELRKVVFE